MEEILGTIGSAIGSIFDNPVISGEKLKGDSFLKIVHYPEG